MNKKDKIYTEQFLMKLSKEQMDMLVYFFGKKNLSRNVREFLIKSVREAHKNRVLPMLNDEMKIEGSENLKENSSG